MELSEHRDHALTRNNQGNVSGSDVTDLEDPQNAGQFDRKLNRRSRWKNLLFGQFIAFIATSQNVISFSLESKMGIVFPLFLMFPAYILLSLHLIGNRPAEGTTQTLHRIPLTTIKIRAPFLYYVGLSLLDVGPNYLILLSLKRTSLTSVSLLGSLTIPSTMLACRFLLDKKFETHHYVGVVFCLGGGFMTILGDSAVSSSESFGGDVLAILGAVLYGLGDAACEFWTKHVDRKEYLGMLGLLGALSTLILFPLLEGEAVYSVFSNPDLPSLAIVLMVVYAVVLTAYYITSTLFLVKCDATLLNLSLQASNLWAIIFSIAAFQESPPPLFFLAVLLVASGVCVYELCGNATGDADSKILQRTSSNPTTVYQSIALL
jgi:drug/metabolite transporter (DMT)-like permease